MRNGIDGLMQSGLEQWLAGQADMREGAKKQAASRWTWGAAIALPVLAFLWFGPAIDVELRLFATLAAAALIAWWGYRPIDAAKQAIKIGINSAIAASFGVAYAHEVEPGAEFEAARTYGLVPGYDRSSFEDRWYGTLQGHDFNLYETHLEEQRGSGKNRRWVTVFRGPVIHMGFGRSFHSTTLLERADLENQRKRVARDIEQARKFANERLLGDLLPVFDSLDAGLAAAGSEPSPLRDGLELTFKQLLKVAGDNGLVLLDPTGEAFNPDHHQAISQADAPDAAPGSVVQVFQKGYVLNGRLLRPALVVVARHD